MRRFHRRKDAPVATPREVRVKDPAASMALIFDAMRNPIDPAYGDAAQRRASGTGVGPRGRASRSPLFVVSVLLIGLLIGASAHALRVPRNVALDRHAQLVQQIGDRQQRNDDLSGQVAALRDDVRDTQSHALSRQSKTSLNERLDAAQETGGLAAVSGAGYVMTVGEPTVADDSADSDPRTGDDAKAITSTDLQQLANGWWQAGATAISINGQRLTSMSAIRFAGSAVLVNFRPLVPPYEISVIAPSGADARVDSGFAGQYAAQLRKAGFTVTTVAQSRLEVPALASVHLAHAKRIAD